MFVCQCLCFALCNVLIISYVSFMYWTKYRVKMHLITMNTCIYSIVDAIRHSYSYYFCYFVNASILSFKNKQGKFFLDCNSVSVYVHVNINSRIIGMSKVTEKIKLIHKACHRWNIFLKFLFTFKWRRNEKKWVSSKN